MFLFSGCCISIFNDTCVIERKVPGPTKLVYESCEFTNPPKEPVWHGEPVSFKRIEFDNQVYYGVTENEAVTLDINAIKKKSYTESLRTTILKYTKKENE
jgi:hypothetical protein